MQKITEKVLEPKFNDSFNSKKSPKIAFFIRNLDGGGAQKVIINLIKGLVKQGIVPDLVLTKIEGPFLNLIPKGVRIINLNSKQILPATIPLSRYLKQEQPDVLVANINNSNVAAVMARMLSSVSTRLLLVEHSTFSFDRTIFPLKSKFLLPVLMRWLYPLADTVVAVSNGVARDLETELCFKQGLVKTIYNPIVDDEILAKAKEPLEHPWFQPGEPPVFLTAGRLELQKNISDLIKAFARLRTQRSARLLILGKGSLQNQLKSLAEELGVESDVSIAGFVANPYAYMSRSAAFVLSSIYEGLPTVLVEAMASGCPVVSTNCPHGPAEILQDNKYGLLVPVNNPIALAEAMQIMMDNPTNQQLLAQRAKDFTVDRVVEQYLKTMQYCEGFAYKRENQ
ncbi:MAG: glycosyltransferase [Scytonematopsis contorta HA4267-MV1]|jgi:glycosyltransferase involved in cell wall biosynthesis|nr:glycosyltransferase [Scytonematopsis contorta HA4267-MV1]